MAWTTPGTATAGDVLTAAFWNLQVRDNLIELNPARTALSTTRYIHVQDQRTSGTSAGTFTSGSYVTRTLQTVVANTISGASLASNQITLPAGTYYVSASAIGHAVDGHAVKIRNATDASDILYGNVTRAGSTAGTSSTAFVNGRFTLSGTKAIELQHRCQTTKATDGLGASNNFGHIEIYVEVIIWQIT